MVLSKAKTRNHLIRKSTDRILAAADKAEPAIRRAMLDALEALQRSVPNLEKLIASGDIGSVVDAVKSAGIPQSLMTALTDATASAAVGGFEAAGFEIAFNSPNTKAVEWAASNVGSLITGTVDIDLIRTVITRGTAEGIHPRLTAKLLRDYVPIFDHQQAIVDRMYDAAIKAGVTPEQAGKVAARKSAKYLKYRTEMIARTEAIRSANMGQQLLWEQATALDYLPAGIEKVWVATGDDRTCRVCAPLDGTPVAVVSSPGKAGEFKIDRQATSFTRSGSDFKVAATKPYAGWGPQPTPPAHPNCRCSLVLEYIPVP